MDNETEVIKHQMLETRTALTEKLEALEDRVASTVKETTEAVGETVETVKEAVEETVETVKETVHETVDTVKETFDLKHQFAERPWLMVGGSVLLGYLGATLLERARGDRATSNGWAPISGHGGQPEERPRPQQEARPSEPSLWDKAVDAFGPAISKLEGLAIGAAAGVIGKMIVNAAPPALRDQLADVINDLTTGLGGKPQPDLLRPDEPNPAV